MAFDEGFTVGRVVVEDSGDGLPGTGFKLPLILGTVEGLDVGDFVVREL